MCNCQSHNRPEITGNVPEIVLDYAKYFPDTQRATVCVDACIAEAIESLWAAGIRTRHSCCGHNEAFGPPSVAIDSFEMARDTAIILKPDGRHWRIFFDLMEGE